MKRCISQILLLFFCTRTCAAESDRFEIDNPRTYQLLAHFLKNGIEQYQYGYILEGVKPVQHRFFQTPGLVSITRSKAFSEEQFFNSLLFEEIAPILDKINQQSTRFLFKIVTRKKEDPDDHELLFIHKPLIEETIRQNLNLFRLALNPTYETRQLLDEILSSDQTLMQILDHHDSLLGVVLGYLPHNSLLGGRSFSLYTQSISIDSPPFERQSRLLQSKEAPDLPPYFVHS